CLAGRPAGAIFFVVAPSLLPLRLGPLRSVLAAAALPSLHADGIERSPHDVVPHAGQVLHASTADQYDRVLLEVVPDARDVGGDLDPVRQPHSGDLAEGRVGLLGGRGEHANAHPALLRRSLESRAIGAIFQLFPTDPDELTYRGQRSSTSNSAQPCESTGFRKAMSRLQWGYVVGTWWFRGFRLARRRPRLGSASARLGGTLSRTG